MPLEARRVDPDLAHVGGDEILEVNRPEMVVRVGPYVLARRFVRREREGRQPGDGRELRDVFGRRPWRLDPLAKTKRDPRSAGRQHVELLARKPEERHAKVDAVEAKDPLDVAVTAPNRQPLGVNRSRED